MLVACISTGCLAPSVDTNSPSTSIDELIGSLVISLKFSNFSSDKTICIFLKKLPSFNSTNPKFLEALDVLIHPATFTVFPIYSSLFLYNSLIVTNCFCILFSSFCYFNLYNLIIFIWKFDSYFSLIIH